MCLQTRVLQVTTSELSITAHYTQCILQTSLVELEMSTRNFRLSQVSLSLLAILGLDGQTNYCQVWLKIALKIYCD